MTDNVTRLADPKLVLKTAQAVWAANKYFVLACGQKYYLQVREELKPNKLELKAAYRTLYEVTNKFKDTKTEDLPELKNALYHMAGYFKNKLSREARQEMDVCIESSPTLALKRLETYTFELNEAYLKISMIWPKHRDYSFNKNMIEIKHKKDLYNPHQLVWKGDYVLYHLEKNKGGVLCDCGMKISLINYQDNNY